MTLLALFEVASAVLVMALIASGAWKRLPQANQLARVMLVAWSLGLAFSALLILVSASDAAERALILLSGMALVVALCCTGLYIRQLGPLVAARKDISQEQIDLYAASAHWTGIILVGISLALVPLALVWAINP